MTVGRRAWLLVPVLVLSCLFGALPTGAQDDTRPHYDASSHRPEYVGPGREQPPPVEIDEIRIGYFGPADPDDPVGGDLWLAANIAVEEANAVGGHDGVLFRLIPAWSKNPWGSGAADLARAVYDDRVWAILGSIDGASTHLAETVVAKARVPLIGPASTDKTVNLANVPWMFSCLPPDDALARLIARALADPAGQDHPTLVSAVDHDSHRATAALLGAMKRGKLAPAHHLEFDPDEIDVGAVVERAIESAPETVIVIAGPLATARIVATLRDLGYAGRLVGWASVGRRAFLEQSTAAADGIIFPLPCDASFVESEFAAVFARRHGHPPDCVTTQSYDATRMLIDAIRRGGLNRALIRDAVVGLSPWQGIAGEIDWGPLGHNRREPVLAVVTGGTVRPLESQPRD